MPHATDIRTRPNGLPVIPGAGNLGGANDVSSAPTVSDVLRRYSDDVQPDRARAPFAPAAPVALKEVALGADGGLFLSKSGNIVKEAGLDRPRNSIEMGDTLFRAAMRAEDGENIFANPKLTVEHKKLALQSLQAAFNLANVAIPAQGGFQNKEQALQVRSCVSPLVLDMLATLSDRKPAELELKKKVMQQYFKLLEAEPHGLARNFMIFDLDRSRKDIPVEFHRVIDTLMNEVAPLHPFYDEWFKNGNNTLKVDYHVGNGFWEEEVQFWVDEGYNKRDNGDGTLTLSKKLDVNGVETNVEMLMHNGPEEIFRKMNDPKTHLVVYSGHANYGRTVTSKIAQGTPQIGNKVFFGLQCGGKGVHNAILEKYSDLQMVQSKNSSYPNEDRNTLLNAIQGMAARKSWVDISNTNRRNNSDNYYFPTDTMVKKRAEDLDGDGIVDAWDRVVNYNRFHPSGSIGDELTAKDPGKDAHELDGRQLEGALNRFLRIAGYNEWTRNLQNQKVLTNGFFNGRPQDPLLEVKDVRDPDGEMIKQVRLNKCYSHASEETLGALLCYELGRAESQKQGLNASDAKASALIMVAKILNVDNGGMDQQVWNALIAAEKLPANVSFQDALAASGMDHDMGGGTRATLAAFKEKNRARGVVL